MEPGSDGEQIAAFFRDLAASPELLEKWVSKTPASAFVDREMNQTARDKLLKGNIEDIRKELHALSSGDAPHRWIVIWVV